MRGYSVIVVDDERSARKMIKNCIDWKTFGITAYYEAADGFAALEIIREKSPDFMILDIKMPQMSGVELLERMKKENLKAHVIVSSGYSDFGTAQQLFKSGTVVGYLLKPVNRDYLAEAVVECINKIDEHRNVTKAIEDLKKARESMRKRGLKDAILGHIEDGDDDFFREEDEVAYQCVAMAVSDGNDRDLIGELQQYIGAESCLKFLFRGELHHSAVLYFESQQANLERDVAQLCAEIADRHGCSVGVGNVCTSRYDLNISYLEALFAGESRSFIPENCISIAEIERILNRNEENILELAALIHRGDVDRIEPFFRRIAESKNMKISYMGVDIRLNEQNFALSKAYFVNLIEQAVDKNHTGVNTALLYAAKTEEDFYKTAKNIITECIADSPAGNPMRRKNLVLQAKGYIEEHYQEHLTLEKVAETIYICPSYLSRLFSETTGKTFIEHVSSVRVEKAKGFLAKRGYKIYEISELVGYRNVKHFIRVFKGYTGMTPTQYREQHIFDQDFEM